MRKKPSIENHEELKGLVEELQRMESGDELLDKTVEAGERAESQRPQPETPRKNIYIIAGLAGLIIVAIVIGIMFFINHARNANVVMVPDVIKLELRAAQTMITSKDLRVRVVFNPSSKAVPGTVLQQQPAAGTQLKSGNEVRLTVAGSNELPIPAPNNVASTTEVTMPAVIGLVDTAARIKLEALGMKVEIIAARDTRQREYMVLASDPAANSKLAPGATVKLTVNMLSPAADANISLLDYAGKAADATINELKSFGFVVTSKKVASRNYSPGVVIGTEPPANSSLAPGSTVTVLIAL